MPLKHGAINHHLDLTNMNAKEVTDRLVGGSITSGWIHCNGVEFWIKSHPFPRSTLLYPVPRIQGLIERHLGLGYDDRVRASVLKLIQIGEDNGNLHTV